MAVRAPMAAVLTLAVLSTAAPVLRADSLRLLGARGDELALTVLHPDLERGFHRAYLGLQDIDRTTLRLTPLLPDARYHALRTRGDYELLVYEREQARRRALASLHSEGFSSCTACRLQEDAPPEDREAEHDAVALSLGGHPLRLVLTEAPPYDLLLIPRSPQGLPMRLGEARGQHLDLGEGARLHLRPHRLRDLFLCGERETLVALVESDDPPHAGVPPHQELVVGLPLRAVREALAQQGARP